MSIFGVKSFLVLLPELYCICIYLFIYLIQESGQDTIDMDSCYRNK